MLTKRVFFIVSMFEFNDQRVSQRHKIEQEKNKTKQKKRIEYLMTIQ